MGAGRGRRKTDRIAQALARARGLKTHDIAGAVRAYAQVLERVPGNPHALAGLRTVTPLQRRALLATAVAMVRSGKSAEALDLMSPLARANPDDAELAEFEIRCCITLKHGDDAVAAARRALRLHADARPIRLAYGLALYVNDDHAGAATVLRALQAEAPLDGEAMNILGRTEEALGDLAAAERAFRASADMTGAAGRAWFNLSKYVNFAAEPESFEQLMRTAGQLRDRYEGEYILYAQAKAWDDLDRPDAAFATLAAANSLQPDAKVADYMENVRATCAGAIEQVERFVPGEAPQALPRLAMIAGMPRSGTTLVEQILMQHPMVVSRGESRAIGQALLQAGDGSAGMAAARLREGAPAGPAMLLIDKMPANILIAGPVLRLLPGARLVHVRRHPMAVCFSNFRTKFAIGNSFSYRLEALAEYHRHVNRMAAEWQQRFPDRVHVLWYEALTEAPEVEIPALVRFLGLPATPDLSRYHGSSGLVRTASVAQVRREIYRGSSEAWRAYADQLAPLTDLLAEDIARHEAGLTAHRASLVPPVAEAG